MYAGAGHHCVGVVRCRCVNVTIVVKLCCVCCTGAGDPRCTVAIVMGVTNPNADRLHRQSMILVPMDTPGVKKIRPLSVFGYFGKNISLYGRTDAHPFLMQMPLMDILKLNLPMFIYQHPT